MKPEIPDHHPDGREGLTCPDCGAYLQAVTIAGADMLRCPWAHPKTWRTFVFATITQIYCDRPLGGARSTSGLYSANT